MAENRSVIKACKILDCLLSSNYANGYSHAELIKLTGYSASDVTRYVSDLVDLGYAEIIAETSRIRAGVKIAQASAQIKQSLDRAIEANQQKLIKIFGGNV